MIYKNPIFTISDLRFRTKKVLDKALKEPVILFHRSSPKGVIISFKKYQEILDQLEDQYLSLKAQEAEKEDKKKVKWISHDKIKSLIKQTK